MATYSELQAQIAELQQQAEALRREERAGVIAEVKAKIVQFGLTARDLGLSGMTSAPATRTRSSGATRFVGPQGQTWTGYGRQPGWLREALAAGKSKADFAV